MSLFVDTLAEAMALPGVYAIDTSPPPPQSAPGPWWVGFVGRFAWGPVNTVTVVSSPSEYLDTFVPGGVATALGSTGHKALMQATLPRLKIVRADVTDAATAAMTLQTADPISVLTVTAKYQGALGSEIVVTISAASDGVATHFNFTATLGTISETWENLKTLSGTGGVYLGDQSSSKLLAPLAAGGGTLSATTRPINGTYTLGVTTSHTTARTAGADGTAVALDYTGTAGTGDAGLALFEGDPDVSIVCVDDTGSGLRVAVNTALVDHAEAEDVLCVLNTDSGVAAADAIDYVGDNAAAFRSKSACLAWPWVKVAAASGAIVTVPPAAFVAGARSRLVRTVAHHWRDDRNTAAYRGIVDLETNTGKATHLTLKRAGVSAWTKTSTGIAVPMIDVSTHIAAGAIDPTPWTLQATKLFLVRGALAGQEAYVGGPIDLATRTEQLGRVKAFLQPLKDAGVKGATTTEEAIVDFSVRTASSEGELAAGVHKIAARVKTFASQNYIVFMLSVGPTVTVEEVAAVAA